MKFKEYELPFNSFMGGWQTDDKIIDDMVDYYNDNKDKRYEGYSYNESEISVNKYFKESFDLSIPANATHSPIDNYLKMLNECCMMYCKKYKDADFELTPWRIIEIYQIQHYN